MAANQKRKKVSLYRPSYHLLKGIGMKGGTASQREKLTVRDYTKKTMETKIGTQRTVKNKLKTGMSAVQIKMGKQRIW